jgi:hypothetical protein
MDRTTLLAPLGRQRLRLLSCLGGDEPRAPGYFVVPEGRDVFAAFGDHVSRLAKEWADERDPQVVSLLAAAKLLTGDIAAAEVIIDSLPAKAAVLDHGAGYCLAMPVVVLSTALPLPPELSDTRRWTAASAEQRDLRAWLIECRADLRWDEAAGQYHRGHLR